MTQAQIPWEGVPVLRCFSGKIHLLSTFSHHSPSRGTSAPTQPNQGRASITFTSRLPLPTVYYCPPSSSSHYLQLQLHNDDLTLPAQYPTTGLSKEQSSHTSSTSLGRIHLSLHALCRHQCQPNQGLSTASSRIDLDQYHTPYKYHRLISTSSDGHFSAAIHSILGDDSNSPTLRVHFQTNCAHAHRDTIATRFYRSTLPWSAISTCSTHSSNIASAQCPRPSMRLCYRWMPISSIKSTLLTPRTSSTSGAVSCPRPLHSTQLQA